MYIPDWAFEKKLKAYDGELSVRWIPRKERWGIYRMTQSPGRLYQRDVLVMVVEDERGNFIELDQRTLDHIARIDSHRNARLLEQLEAEQEKLVALKYKDHANEIEDISRVIAPLLLKEMREDNDFTANVPKEDLRKKLVSRYGEEVL